MKELKAIESIAVKCKCDNSFWPKKTLHIESCVNNLLLSFMKSHVFDPLRCDTVTSSVMMQYSHDFKAHLASLFLSESVDVGKKYIFDVQRTSKEAYDRARRTLFKSSAHPHWRRMSTEEEEGCCEGWRETSVLRHKLQRLQEALTCALCCDREISTAFCPCGHIVCCHLCAAQLQVTENCQCHA